VSETPRINNVERRWRDDRKISGNDVEFLIRRARAAETMAAAKKLDSSRDILGDLFGGFGR